MAWIIFIGFGILTALWFLASKASKIHAPTKARLANQSNPLYMLPERFVVFDLETTGLSPRDHDIIEVAAIRVNRESDIQDTFQTFVKIDGIISKRITELTGINKEMVMKDGLPLNEAMSEFKSFIGNLPLVAYNVEFDQKFMTAALNRLGNRPLENRHICALKMARAAWPKRSSYKLQHISADGGLSVSDSHRALGDCRRALLVYAAAARILRRDH